MKNSKRKGKCGELDAKDVLSRLFGRDVRRSVQYSGADGDADLVGLPGVHVEVKRSESFRMWDALDQAKADAKGGRVPVVLHRKNRRDWVVILELEDLPALVRALDTDSRS